MLVEPAGPGDHAEVRALFRATVALGRPLPFARAAPRLVDAYERLCLDAYLERPCETVVGILRDAPGCPARGYALVCANRVRLRGRGRALIRFTGVAVAALLGRQRREVAPFVLGRLADARRLGRSPRRVRGLPHAHLNAAAHPSTLPGRALADFVDTAAAASGHAAWYGEINARRGRRAQAISRRWGADVVHRAPNHTLSRLLGEPVERLTVVRPVSPLAAGGPEASSDAARSRVGHGLARSRGLHRTEAAATPGDARRARLKTP